MKFFQDQIYAAIHDQKKEDEYTRHFDTHNEQAFRQLNDRGYGIYITANSFNGGFRNKGTLKKLNAIVGDLDIAKSSKHMPIEEKDEKKRRILINLRKYCPPSWVVITKNGIQPWYLIDEEKIDKHTLQLYEGVMCGLIDLSIEFGGLGDEAKDVTRLWRMPGYLHQKSEPFQISEMEGNNHAWELETLKEFFWREPKKEKIYSGGDSDNPLWREMDKIDIREIVIRAGAELGDKIEFGKDGHLILNGERRGTFVGRGGRCIATQSSVYPIKGNRVTVVADMLKMSRHQAVQWICREFDTDPRIKLYG